MSSSSSRRSFDTRPGHDKDFQLCLLTSTSSVSEGWLLSKLPASVRALPCAAPGSLKQRCLLSDPQPALCAQLGYLHTGQPCHQLLRALSVTTCRPLCCGTGPSAASEPADKSPAMHWT